MSDDEIDQSNEIIASFMELRKEISDKYTFPRWFVKVNDGRRLGEFVGYTHQLQYHSSWDWLMPVVKKIRPLWRLSQSEEAASIMAHMFDSDIDKVYECVVEFIRKQNDAIRK
jgi:hypothetical protein